MLHRPQDLLTSELVTAINSDFQTDHNKAAYTVELLHRMLKEREGVEAVGAIIRPALSR